MEGPEQFAPSARIAADELAGLEAGVGDVAAAPAGNAHLGQRVGRRLMEQHLAGGAHRLRAGDGREEAGGAPAGDHHTPLVLHGATVPPRAGVERANSTVAAGG